MGDLAADKNQIPKKKSRQSIFDSSKFWGLGPQHKESLSEDIEIHPAKTKKEDSLEHQPEITNKVDSLEHQPEITKNVDSLEHLPEITNKVDSQEQITKNNPKTSKPSNVKLCDTTNGKFIFTRGWDGTNMSVYQIRRKNL